MESFDVFISYASPDEQIARLLANGLSEKGLRIWLAVERLAPGNNIAEQIGRAIKQSRMGALIVSAEADVSKPWVSREWAAVQERAWSRSDFAVLTIALDRVELPVFLHRWPHLALDRQDPDIGAAVESIANVLQGKAPLGISSPENADEVHAAAVERFSQIKHSIKEQMEEVARIRGGEGLHE